MYPHILGSMFRTHAAGDYYMVSSEGAQKSNGITPYLLCVQQLTAEFSAREFFYCCGYPKAQFGLNMYHQRQDSDGILQM